MILWFKMVQVGSTFVTVSIKELHNIMQYSI
jgi:hypothetical protein